MMQLRHKKLPASETQTHTHRHISVLLVLLRYCLIFSSVSNSLVHFVAHCSDLNVN